MPKNGKRQFGLTMSDDKHPRWLRNILLGIFFLVCFVLLCTPNVSFVLVQSRETYPSRFANSQIRPIEKTMGNVLDEQESVQSEDVGDIEDDTKIESSAKIEEGGHTENGDNIEDNAKIEDDTKVKDTPQVDAPKADTPKDPQVDTLKSDTLQDDTSQTDSTKEGPDMSYVYSYYEPALGYAHGYIQRMMRLWLRTWHMHGYKPRILTLKDTEKHPNFTRLTDTFSQFPTVNPRHYELTCFRRWMAFQMVGGGTFMDYDILALGDVHFPQVGPDEIYSYPFKLWPMLTHAGPSAISRQLELMANFTGPYSDFGGPHISDMIIMRLHPEFYTKIFAETPNVYHFWYAEWDALNKVMPCSRDTFGETVALMARLYWRRVVMVMPPGMAIQGDQAEYGLKIANVEEAWKMQDWLNKDEPSKHLMPNHLAQEEMQVKVATQWPADFEKGLSLVLLVYSESSIGLYDIETQKAIEAHLDSSDLVPLPSSNPQNCRMLIDYNLGVAGRKDISFALPTAEGKNESLCNVLNKRVELLMAEITPIEDQLATVGL